jgi:hypothetical protein
MTGDVPAKFFPLVGVNSPSSRAASPRVSIELSLQTKGNASGVALESCSR